ncbi:DEAD/DEAH box helicase [Solitalea koreensis]|uniref:ATP-dependent RNA helicase RhlE n=1 Tax=Solitalea koreensis TaxID=543615 RepID=A0A521D387_9SPHI|nr:DEAD/DEAH box helicase [Solitalea koreensis]SMO65370.1 ATP-dependent RNA helicase RhlE [Solitalea koreensis]
MSLDKLKLSKQLVAAMTDAGYLTPKEIQTKTLSRIIGGQDIIGIGPEGCGKTTAYVLGVLMRLKYSTEDAPRALILVPDAERVEAVIDQFKLLAKNKSVRVIGLHPQMGQEEQLDLLAEGCDIVVATPDRARSHYLKFALNLNLIQVLVIDDAELLIKKGFQLPITELARSITKCQRLVFSEVIHSKLEKLIEPFMNQPALIEVNLLAENKAETHEQLLYHVPNFRTKQNLLNLLMSDDEIFTKVLVFVNTRYNAQVLYKSLNKRLPGEVVLYKPMFFDQLAVDSVEEFKELPETRILIIANETYESTDIHDVPFIIHFELPLEKETLVGRIVKRSEASTEEILAITFATDLELSMVRKIEQSTGQKMPLADFPPGLIIVGDRQKSEASDSEEEEEEKDTTPTKGAAFHPKKEKNAKTTNYSSKVKAKMKYKK